MPTFGIQARQGLGSRSRLVRLALSSVLVLAVVGADADGPPAAVSSEAWSSIQAQIEVERHTITESERPGRLYRADNPTQRFTAHFGSEDVALVPRGGGEPAWELGLRLTAWGAAHDLQPVNLATISARDNRVEFRRGSLTEWYLNTTMGLEQGFIIEAPPGDGIDELVLGIALEGNLTAELAENGQSVTFRHDASGGTLTYSGLAAWDATGATLEAGIRLVNGGKELRLLISVIGAAWPITLDPIIAQAARLLPTPLLDSTDAKFGQAVALEADTMVVGIRKRQHGGSAAAHFFERRDSTSGTWEHVEEIIPDAVLDGFGFGGSVAISGDTAVIGSYGDDDNGYFAGAAYVFQRLRGELEAWGLIAKIIAADGARDDNFGRSIAISGDIVVGGAIFGDNYWTDSGSAYVFQRNEGGVDAWGQVAKITASDGYFEDYFGVVAVSGDTAIVGASYSDVDGYNSGSAYIFQRDHGGINAWGQVVKIIPTDGAPSDHFGASVAISGDFAIVGAPGDEHDNTRSGSAYIFRRDLGGPEAWGQIAKLIPTDGEEDDSFGWSVSITGNNAVVGAYRDDDGGLDSGSAYVFQRDQGGPDAWGQVAKIIPTDAEQEMGFGSRVAIAGDTAVVGAPLDDDDFEDSGSTYVFRRDEGGADAWGQEASLSCPPIHRAYDDLFGYSVAVSGDTAIIGAWGDDQNGTESGSAYVFQRDSGGAGTWGKVSKITAADGESEDRFGWSVAIGGHYALVGSPYDDDNGDSSGSAYVFHNEQRGSNTWEQLVKLTAADGAALDLFGYDLAISSDTAVIGAKGDDDNGSGSGSAYIFQHDQSGSSTWRQVDKITADDGEASAYFGHSVAISDDTIIVGAYNHNQGNFFDPGTAYIFQRDPGGTGPWGQIARIAADDGARGDSFGYSVAISANTAIVGSPDDDDNGYSSGSAYVFERDQVLPDSWGQIAKVTPADGQTQDQYGRSVSISGGVAVVGACDETVTPSWNYSGSAHVLRRDQGGLNAWGQIAKVTSTIGIYNDNFGMSVSTNGGVAIVGAFRDLELGYDSGSAYVFMISDTLFVDGFETGDTSGWSVTVP